MFILIIIQENVWRINKMRLIIFGDIVLIKNGFFVALIYNNKPSVL